MRHAEYETEPVTDPLAFGPPEETVWRKYSSNFEFPISLVISTLLLTTLFAILVGLLFLALGSGPEKKVPPMSLVDDGDDEAGAGSPGDSGKPDEALAPKRENQTQTSGDETLQTRFDLPEIQDVKAQIALEDPTAESVAVAPENAKSYQRLDDEIRKRLLDIGGKKGQTGVGKGDGTPGAGPGGPGAEGTRARSLRWVMRFKTNGGRDYLDQLQAMGAIVLVPFEKQMYVFKDLRNPRPGTFATPEELTSYSQQMQFCDPKESSAEEVGKALNLGFTPREFWAIFPKGIEEELAKLEKGYRNRRADDIEQTIFQVSVVGGRHRFVVSEQTERLKR